MTATQPNADQVEYWNGAAGQKWVTSQERLDAMLATVSRRLLEQLEARPGERILDIGCGCGDTTIALADSGALPTGVDVSHPMLERARQRAPHVEFIRADATTHAFSSNHDALVSRFGVMFFSDPELAFTNLRKALKPDGRLVFACWRDWRENEWVKVPVSAVRPLMPPQPQLGPEDPGPFAFADLARVRRILTGAGFDRITAQPFDTDLSFGATLEDAIAHLAEIGPVARMLADATPDQKGKAMKALEAALQSWSGQSPVTMGGAVWMITARA
jgi:SAM-dependent methyltransferase